MELAKWVALAFVISDSGCATYQNDTCPSIAREAVSGCRARMKCQTRSKTNYTVGFRSPAALLAENYGIDMGQSPVTDNFNECISRNLQEQGAINVIERRGIP